LTGDCYKAPVSESLVRDTQSPEQGYSMSSASVKEQKL
jgi:hypothetical protein